MNCFHYKIDKSIIKAAFIKAKNTKRLYLNIPIEKEVLKNYFKYLNTFKYNYLIYITIINNKLIKLNFINI